MNENRTSSIISVSTGAFFAICFVLLLQARSRNAVLQEQVDSEKLKSEALLSEKLHLEKSLIECSNTTNVTP